MTSFWKSFDDLFTKVHYVQGPSWQTVSFEFLEDGFEILRNFASTFSFHEMHPLRHLQTNLQTYKHIFGKKILNVTNAKLFLMSFHFNL